MMMTILMIMSSIIIIITTTTRIITIISHRSASPSSSPQKSTKDQDGHADGPEDDVHSLGGLSIVISRASPPLPSSSPSAVSAYRSYLGNVFAVARFLAGSIISSSCSLHLHHPHQQHHHSAIIMTHRHHDYDHRHQQGSLPFHERQSPGILLMCSQNLSYTC